jgi:hypothetical protein
MPFRTLGVIFAKYMRIAGTSRGRSMAAAA